MVFTGCIFVCSNSSACGSSVDLLYDFALAKWHSKGLRGQPCMLEAEDEDGWDLVGTDEEQGYEVWLWL